MVIRWFFVLILVLSPLHAELETTRLLVGEKFLKFPILEGYERVDGRVRNLDVYLHKATPPLNRFKMAYWPDGGLEAMMKSEQVPDIQVRIHTQRQFELAKVGSEEFAKAMGIIKEHVKKSMDGTLEQPPKTDGEKVGVEVKKNVYHKPFLDETARFGVSKELSVKIERRGEIREVENIMAIVHVHVKEKVVIVEVSRRYLKPEDVTQAEALAKKWSAALVAANKG